MKSSSQKSSSLQHTLEFDDPRLLRNLYHDDEKLLRTMEEVLAITVTTRDGWIRFAGSSAAIKRAAWTFNHLQQLDQRDTVIGPYDFLDALHQSAFLHRQ